jgi:MoxR-like ATPase
MKRRYVTGTAAEPPNGPIELPVPLRQKQTDPAGYLMDPPLADAVNVALMLSQPLLLTGEPGTGKTQLAWRIAWELGYGEPLVFNTKTTSVARDLFYTFDTLGRFQAAQTGEGSRDNLDYITFNALGLAILRSRARAEVEAWLPAGAAHDGPRRSVVLIDEVDKAPRDFPNDLLHEVDNLAFRVPELRNCEIAAERTLRPILVLTSNSEKNLPDAFLRRCIFFNIPSPDRGRLVEIVRSRVSGFRDGSGRLLDSALDFFLELRKQGLRKPPSTAELINWLQAMAEGGAALDHPIGAQRPVLDASLSALAKTREDAEDLARFVKTYLGS